ncbi:MAG: signal peptidase II [Propioniciclava sp.]
MISSRAVWTIALTIGLVGYALDQVTKELALRYLDPANPPVLLGGLLTLQLIRNPGAAFSLGENYTPVLSVISTVALIAVLGWLIPRTRYRAWAITLGLLLGGILGNLTDRLARPPGFAHGHVIDFLQLPHFAIFNVADMCVTFAAVGMVWLMLVRGVDLRGNSTKEAPPDEESAVASAGGEPAGGATPVVPDAAEDRSTSRDENR